MMTLAATQSTARAPLHHAGRIAGHPLEQTLAAARVDARFIPSLYGALLHGEVYVTDCEMVLGEQGPYVELWPGTDCQGRMLAVYPSMARVPEGQEAEAVSFVAVLDALSPGVAVVLDPGGPLQHRIDAIDLELLRRALD